MATFAFVLGVSQHADFDVQLDTGSSDLWIRTPKAPLTIRNDSGLHPVNLTYGSGWASGPIQFAEVKIGEYVIPSQGVSP